MGNERDDFVCSASGEKEFLVDMRDRLQRRVEGLEVLLRRVDAGLEEEDKSEYRKGQRELLPLLKRLQWSGLKTVQEDGESRVMVCCPMCKEWEGDGDDEHAKGCELVAAIKRIEGERH